MKLVRSGTGPVFRSTAPDWLDALLLRGPCVARKIGAEDGDCIMFADRLREASLNGRMRAAWTHIPHEVGGGSKNAALRYSLANAMGLVAGSFDYVFVWPDGGGWIEFKRSALRKTDHRAARAAGRLSDNQKLFSQWCGSLDVRHAVARSSAEGLDILKGWGVYDPE